MPDGDVVRPELRTIEDFEQRQTDVRRQLVEMDNQYAGQQMPENVRGQWNSLNDEFERNTDVLIEMRLRADRLRQLGPEDADVDGGSHGIRAGSELTRRHGRATTTDIYDTTAIRQTAVSPEDATRMFRDNAMRAIDRATFPHPDADRERSQAHVEGLMDRFRAADEEFGSQQVQFLARRILDTGSPIYRRAFSKLAAGLSPTVDEQRALSLTNTAGGYAVPFTLDPTIIPTSNLSVNPYRAIARQVTIATTTWQGITSAGVSASYAAEANETTDDSPTIGQPTATPVRCDVFIPFSVEIGQDWGAMEGDLATVVQDAKDDAEATKFTSGGGTNEPQGLLTGATTVVTGAGTGTFAIADLYSLEQSLGPRFRPRAQFIGNRGIYNLIRQFDTGGGGGLWLQQAPLGVGLQNNVPRPGNIGAELLGYPANEASPYSGTVATGNNILTLGDFRYFLIVDRIGMQVELIQNLVGTNRRPTGQRGLFYWWRNTSVVLSANAFRTLKVK